jgi:signal transduction histidine kinase
MPMRGFLRRLREKQCFDEKEANYLEIVEQESSNLDRMVKEMLAFGRHAPLQREEVEVRSLVDDMRHKLDDASFFLYTQCFEAGDDIEQFFVNATLA